MLHSLDSEIRIDAAPSLVASVSRISAGGARHLALSLTGVANAHESRKRERWRPQPEALLGDKGMIPKASPIAFRCGPSKRERYEKDRRTSLAGRACALAWLK
jgi:hypothetical protein